MQTIAIAPQRPAEALLCSGHAACPGCVEPLSVRHILDILGPDTMLVIPPSCMAIIAGPQPFSSLRVPVYQPTLESSAAAASGLRRALDAQGKQQTQVVVLDRNHSPGAGGVLHQELRAALFGAERAPRVHGYLAGVGGVSVSPEMIGRFVRQALAGAAADESIWVR